MYKLVAFALLMCASASAAEEPKWLKDARAREGKIAKLAELKSKDGWFKARVPAKVVSPIELSEGSYSVELDMGGEASINCEVYPGGLDLANALRLTLENTLKEIETSQGKIEVRAVDAMDAGAHGAVPFITVNWVYRVATKGGARVGALKQFVTEKGGVGVYCAHNDIGYSSTFATITKAFAESLESQAPAVNPYYIEISTASIANTKIGVSVSTLELDADGDTKAKQMTALFLATGGGAVQSQDSNEVAWLRPDSTLINASHVEVANGDIQNDLALKAEDDAWLVEGTIQGKAIKTKLPKNSQPGSWVAQARELRTLLADPNPVGREHTMGMWLSENPDKLTVAKTRILARQGDKLFTARGEIGGITANLTLEKATGMASAADLKIGPLNITLQRVYVNGSF
jgi:hypothetical protein